MGRLTFRILPNIHDGALLQNNQRLEHVGYFGKKAPSQVFDWILNVKLQNKVSLDHNMEL